MSLQDVFTPLDPSKSSELHNHPLWALLGSGNHATTSLLPPKILNPALPIGSKDKTATSLRLLLCDAQNTLEGFSTKVDGLTKLVERAATRMDETAKLIEDRQVAASDELKILLTRVQTSVSKSFESMNDSVRVLAEKMELNHVQEMAKHDNLQQQIMILTQQVALNLEEQKEFRKTLTTEFKGHDEQLTKVGEMMQEDSKKLSSNGDTLSKLAASMENLPTIRCSCSPNVGLSVSNDEAQKESNLAEAHNMHPVTGDNPLRPSREVPRLVTALLPTLHHHAGFSLVERDTIDQPTLLPSSGASTPMRPPAARSPFVAPQQMPRSRHSSLIKPDNSYTFNRPFAPLPTGLSTETNYIQTPRGASRQSSFHFGATPGSANRLSNHNRYTTEWKSYDEIAGESDVLKELDGNKIMGDGLGKHAAENELELANKRFKPFMTPRRPVRRMIEQATSSGPSPGTQES